MTEWVLKQDAPGDFSLCPEYATGHSEVHMYQLLSIDSERELLSLIAHCSPGYPGSHGLGFPGEMQLIDGTEWDHS